MLIFRKGFTPARDAAGVRLFYRPFALRDMMPKVPGLMRLAVPDASPSLRRQINPQHLNKLRYLAQMSQGVPRRLVIATQEVYIENILPGASAQGARLDLAQADVAQREDAERFEERSRKVLNLESNGGLVGSIRNQPLVGRRGSGAKILA